MSSATAASMIAALTMFAEAQNAQMDGYVLIDDHAGEMNDGRSESDTGSETGDDWITIFDIQKSNKGRPTDEAIIVDGVKNLNLGPPTLATINGLPVAGYGHQQAAIVANLMRVREANTTGSNGVGMNTNARREHVPVPGENVNTTATGNAPPV